MYTHVYVFVCKQMCIWSGQTRSVKSTDRPPTYLHHPLLFITCAVCCSTLPAFTCLLAGSPATAHTKRMDQFERGRPRRRSGSFRKPFKSFKQILTRRKNTNRSASRDRSTSLPRFSSGIIDHAHNIQADPNLVPLYLPIHIELSGAILAPDESTKVGTVICSCGPQSHVSNVPKHILFSSRQISQLDINEHFVSSPFIVPEVSESYRRIQKSFPILFRLDPAFQEVVFGEPLGGQISFDSLKSAIHDRLLELDNLFNNEDVNHVYEKLFDIIPQAEPNLIPSAPLYHDDHDDGRQVEEEAHSSLEQAPPPPAVQARRPIEPRPFSPPNPPPTTQKDFLGILFVPNPSASLLDIPKLESVKLLENCIRNWSSAGYKAVFISRNLGTNQVDLFPFLTAPPVNPFTPSAVSPQKMYAAILNSSEIGATGSPRMTLHPTHRLAKWYSRIYQGVVDQNLFSKPPSSLSVRTSTTPPESEDDGEDRQSHRPSRPPPPERIPPQISSATAVPAPPVASCLTIDVYTPPILNRSDCPPLFHTFWNLKAYPRPSIYEKGKPVTEGARFVAPRYPVRMTEVATHVNLPNLLSDEFESYAKVYQAIVVERQYSSLDACRGNVVHLAIQNDAAVLSMLGKDKILDTIKKNAPVLREQKLENLTEAELQSFFFQARTYLLDNQAPYWSFPEYFLNPRTLGPSIFNKITELLWGYPTYKSTLRQFSSFIESSIRQILPIQESFTDSEERIIANHKSLLLGPVPSVEHTKISLQADAQELLIKSPHYKQHQNEITEDEKRRYIDMYKLNLLIKIISNSHFETDLIQLLIANDKYRSLDVVPFPELISNIENLILVAQKAETIEVNAARNGSGRLSRPASRARATPTTKATKKSPTPKSPSPRPPRPRSRNPSGGQEACDICLLFEFDFRWCRQQDHCRVSGHQPASNRSQTREKQIRNGDLSCFVLRRDCNKCNPRVMHIATPPFLSWPTSPYSHSLVPPPTHPPRPPSPNRPFQGNQTSRWSVPPPRPSNQRQSSKSPSRFSANRR